MRFYRARVAHRRRSPVRYRFDYRVFALLLDLDRLEQDASRLRLLSLERFNLLSFHRRDHGPRDGSPLRPWIDALLRHQAGIDLEGGRVRLLCMPRVLGYGFNPLSLWYCEHRDGRLRAVLCEVHNTFGEAHGYLLHAHGAPLAWPVRGRKAKRLHVSPLIGMDAAYHFRIDEPGERATIAITEYETAAGEDAARVVLTAAWDGRARPLDDVQLARACLTLPLMTLGVMAAIHWQALLAWLRGAPWWRKPAPPPHGVS